MPLPRYLTPNEFLAALQLATGRQWSRSSLYRAIAQARIQAIKLGGKIMIDRLAAELDLNLKLTDPQDKN